MISVGDVIEATIGAVTITRTVDAENIATIRAWIAWGAEVKRIG